MEKRLIALSPLTVLPNESTLVAIERMPKEELLCLFFHQNLVRLF